MKKNSVLKNSNNFKRFSLFAHTLLWRSLEKKAQKNEKPLNSIHVTISSLFRLISFRSTCVRVASTFSAKHLWCNMVFLFLLPPPYFTQPLASHWITPKISNTWSFAIFHTLFSVWFIDFLLPHCCFGFHSFSFAIQLHRFAGERVYMHLIIGSAWGGGKYTHSLIKLHSFGAKKESSKELETFPLCLMHVEKFLAALWNECGMKQGERKEILIFLQTQEEKKFASFCWLLGRK